MELPHTESVWRLRGGWWVTGKRVRFFLKIQVWLFSCHAKPRGAARKAEGFLTCLCCQGVCEGYFRLEVYVCDNCTTVKLVCFRTLCLCVCVCACVCEAVSRAACAEPSVCCFSSSLPVLRLICARGQWPTSTFCSLGAHSRATLVWLITRQLDRNNFPSVYLQKSWAHHLKPLFFFTCDYIPHNIWILLLVLAFDLLFLRNSAGVDGGMLGW